MRETRTRRKGVTLIELNKVQNQQLAITKIIALINCTFILYTCLFVTIEIYIQ